MGKTPVQFGKATLKKEEKLCLHSEFDYVRCSGREFPGRLMLMVVAESPDPSCGIPRFGVICSRRFSGKAVVRNRARRLIKESFRLIKNNVRPCNVLFITRKALLGKRLLETQKEMMYLLAKANFWMKND
ncbi:MAG: ribonuclease P protein component [Victivallales bacterium]